MLQGTLNLYRIISRKGCMPLVSYLSANHVSIFHSQTFVRHCNTNAVPSFTRGIAQVAEEKEFQKPTIGMRIK